MSQENENKEKMNPDLEQNEIRLPLKQATEELIRLKKLSGQILYDELTKELAIPYSLDADQIDQLIQTIEDQGIAVVGEDGGPTLSLIHI